MKENVQIACSNCNIYELCMPVKFNLEKRDKLDSVVSQRKKIKQGESLFTSKTKFSALYAIKLGFFKTTINSHQGHEQVTGFQMSGEIIGLDGIADNQHTCNAIALEDSEVCIMPFSNLQTLAHEIPSLQSHLNKIMSREIVRESGMIVLLSTMSAKEKLSNFLSNLIQRLSLRGQSSHELILRMSREEIASYLGLSKETVTRVLSKYSDQNILEVNNRFIKILNSEAIKSNC